jgi:hypothetical protein
MIERIANKLNQKVIETPSADYPYRFTIAKGSWAHYLREAASLLQYYHSDYGQDKRQSGKNH